METVKRIRALVALSISNLFLHFKQSSPPPPPASFVPDLEMMQEEALRIPMPQTNSKILTPEDWGKTIMEFCFTTSIALLAMSLQTKLSLSLSFHLFSLLVILAFSSSFIAIMFRTRFPTAAGLLEQMGIIFAVLAFFSAMAISLPLSLKWVTWVICAASLFSFCIYYRTYDA